MRFGFGGRRLAGVFGIAFVGLAIAGGVAYATIPDSNGVITGCYSVNGSKQTNGTPLNVVDSANSCSKGQQAIPWSQTGPAGQSGPAGPTGPTGPAGPSDLYDNNHYVGGYTPLTKGAQTVVNALGLPAGSFYVEASFTVQNTSSGADFACTLNVPSTYSYAQADTMAAGQHTVIHLQAAVTLTNQQGTTADFACITNQDNSQIDEWNVDAIEVGTVHDQS